MVIVGATELLIETVELPMAFIGDWGGLDGFERAVPVERSPNRYTGAHGTTEPKRRDKWISIQTQKYNKQVLTICFLK